MLVQVTKEHYEKYDSEYRFVQYWNQIEEVITRKDIKSVLEIGCGNKTVTDYLRKKGIDVTTVDFAADLNPDIVADLTNLNNFNPPKKDCVLACEVLEHIPLEDLDIALSNIYYSTKKYVIISVPQYYMKFGFVINIGLCFWEMFKELRFRIPYFMIKPKFSGEHYWGLGLKGISKNQFKKMIENAGFQIIKEKVPKVYQDIYYLVAIKSKHL